MSLNKFFFLLITLYILIACVKKVEAPNTTTKTDASINEISINKDEKSALMKNEELIDSINLDSKSANPIDYVSQIDKYNDKLDIVDGILYAAIELKNSYAEITIANIENQELWKKIKVWKEYYSFYDQEKEILKEIIKDISNKYNISYENYFFLLSRDNQEKCDKCNNITDILLTDTSFKGKFDVNEFDVNELNLSMFKVLIPNDFRDRSIGFHVDDSESTIYYSDNHKIKTLRTYGSSNEENSKIIFENIKSKLNDINIPYNNCFITGIDEKSNDTKSLNLIKPFDKSLFSDKEKVILNSIEQSKNKPTIYNNNNASYAIQLLISKKFK